MSQSRGEGSGGEGAFGGVSSSLPDDVGRLRARIQVQVSRIELQERRIAQLQREKDEAVAYASQQQVKLKGGEQGGRGYGAPSSSFSSRSQRRRGSSWGEGPGIGEEERLREEQDALASENDRLQQRVEELERRNHQQLQLLRKLQSRCVPENQERRGGPSAHYGSDPVLPTTEEGQKERACYSSPGDDDRVHHQLSGGWGGQQTREGLRTAGQQEVRRMSPSAFQPSTSLPGRVPSFGGEREEQRSLEELGVAGSENRKRVEIQTLEEGGAAHSLSGGCLDTADTLPTVSTSGEEDLTHSSRVRDVIHSQLGDIRQELINDGTRRRKGRLRDIRGDAAGDSFSASARGRPFWSSSFPLFATCASSSLVPVLESREGPAACRRGLFEREAFLYASPLGRFPPEQGRESGVRLGPSDEVVRNKRDSGIVGFSPCVITAEEEICLFREFDHIMLRRGANSWGPVISASAVMSVRASLRHLCSCARAFSKTETVAEVLGTCRPFSWESRGPRARASSLLPFSSSTDIDDAHRTRVSGQSSVGRTVQSHPHETLPIIFGRSSCSAQASQKGFCPPFSSVLRTSTGSTSVSADGVPGEEGACPGAFQGRAEVRFFRSLHRERSERKRQLKDSLATLWRLLNLELIRAVGLSQEPAWICAFLDFLNRLFVRLPCCARVLFFSDDDTALWDTSVGTPDFSSLQEKSEGEEKHRVFTRPVEHLLACEENDEQKGGPPASTRVTGGCRRPNRSFASSCGAGEGDVRNLSERNGEAKPATFKHRDGKDAATGSAGERTMAPPEGMHEQSRYREERPGSAPVVEEVVGGELSQRGWLIKQILKIVHAALKRLDNDLPDDVASTHSVRTRKQKNSSFLDAGESPECSLGEDRTASGKQLVSPCSSLRQSSSLAPSLVFATPKRTSCGHGPCNAKGGSGPIKETEKRQSSPDVFLSGPAPQVGHSRLEPKQGGGQHAREEAHTLSPSRTSVRGTPVKDKQQSNQTKGSTHDPTNPPCVSLQRRALNVNAAAKSPPRRKPVPPPQQSTSEAGQRRGRQGPGHEQSGEGYWTDALRPLDLTPGDEQLPRYPLPFFYRMLFFGVSRSERGPSSRADGFAPSDALLPSSPSCVDTSALATSPAPPPLWSFVFVLQRLLRLLGTIATHLIKHEQHLRYLLRDLENSVLLADDDEACSEIRRKDFSSPRQEKCSIGDRRGAAFEKGGHQSTLSRLFSLRCFLSKDGRGTTAEERGTHPGSGATFSGDFQAAYRLYMRRTVWTELRSLRASLFPDFFIPVDAFPALHEILQMHALTNPPITGEPLPAPLLTLVPPWLIEEVGRVREQEGAEQTRQQTSGSFSQLKLSGGASSSGLGSSVDSERQRETGKRSDTGDADWLRYMAPQQPSEAFKKSIVQEDQTVGFWLQASLDYFQHPPPPLAELRLAGMDLVRKVLLLSGYSFGDLLQAKARRLPGSEPTLPPRDPVQNAGPGAFGFKGSSGRAGGNEASSRVSCHAESTASGKADDQRSPSGKSSKEALRETRKHVDLLAAEWRRGRVPGRDLLQAISVFVCCESSLWMRKKSLWLYGAPFLQCASFLLRSREVKIRAGEKAGDAFGTRSDAVVVNQPEEDHGQARQIQGRTEEGKASERIKPTSGAPEKAAPGRQESGSGGHTFLSGGSSPSSLFPVDPAAAECAALRVRERALRVFEALLLQPNNEELFLGRLESWHGSTPYTSTLIQRVVLLAWYLVRPLSSVARPSPPAARVTSSAFPLYQPIELQQLLQQVSPWERRRCGSGAEMDQTYLHMLTGRGGNQSLDSEVKPLCFSSTDFPQPRLSFVRRHFTALKRVRQLPGAAYCSDTSSVCPMATPDIAGSPSSPGRSLFYQIKEGLRAKDLSWDICEAHVTSHSTIRPEEAHYVRAELLRSSLCSALVILTHKVRLGGWQAERLSGKFGASSVSSTSRDQSTSKSANESAGLRGGEGAGERGRLVGSSGVGSSPDVAQHSEQHFLSSDLLGRTWPLLRALAGALEAEGCENEFSVLGSFQHFSTLIHAALA